MTMAFNSEQLRKTGDPADELIATMLELRIKRKGDFDFPPDPEQSSTQSTHEYRLHKDREAHAALEACYALADDTATIKEPVSGEQIEKTAHLYTDMLDLVQDIPLMVTAKIPSVKDNKRNWLGKLERDESLEWKSTGTIGNKTIFHHFVADYTQSKNRNTANSLTMYFSDTAEASTETMPAYIQMIFENDAVAEIKFCHQGDTFYNNNNCNNRNGLFRSVLLDQADGTAPFDSVEKDPDTWIAENDLIGNPADIASNRTTFKGSIKFQIDTITFTIDSYDTLYERIIPISSVRRIYDGTSDSFETIHTDQHGRETTLDQTKASKVMMLIAALRRAIPTTQY